MKHLMSARLASAILLVIASVVPATAEENCGDDSQVGQCKTLLDQQKLAVSTEKDATKKAAAAQELTMAQGAMGKGNQTLCLVHLQKVNNALK
jgi:hypothetical protein